MRERCLVIGLGLLLAACGSHGAENRGAQPSGNTTELHAGDSLQAALDAAQPGDELVLDAGSVFSGPFTLPRKTGEGWITIRSSAVADLPPAGTRVTPAQADNMPKLESRSKTEPVISAAPGAHHYRFVGVEIRPRAGSFLFNVVLLGQDERTQDALPHDFAFERCYIHGDPRAGSRRGIALNSGDTRIVDSHLSDFKEVGADSQAIAGWNGPGPFHILNNYIEAAGENVMFGGAVPAIPDLVPSDIEVRGNHFDKPLGWRVGDPGYQGREWAIKNLFELKNARRVVVDGNLFEHCWAHAQSGFAILFTVRTEDGRAPWAVVEDVTFSNNTVRDVASGINILGFDPPAGRTQRIQIRNNLFERVDGERWGGGGIVLQILSGPVDVGFEHNTALQSGSIVVADEGPSRGFVYRSNIALQNAYGIQGSGTATGNATLEAYFPGAAVRRNVFVGASSGQYPKDNFFPRSLDDVGFVAPASGNYRLGPRSPYKGAAADGGDVGVDFETLAAASDQGK